MNDPPAHGLQGRVVDVKDLLRPANEHRDIAGFGAVHAAGDRAGERRDSAQPARAASASTSAKSFVLISIHVAPERISGSAASMTLAVAAGEGRQVINASQVRASSATDAAQVAPASRTPAAALSIQVVNDHVEPAAHQIRGEVLAEIPKTDETVAHSTPPTVQPSGRSAISRCSFPPGS